MTLSRLKKCFLFAALALVVALGVAIWRAFRPLQPVPLVESRDTTFLSGPRRADGTIDYHAAVVALLQDGVTRENNAAIPLLQACGPKSLVDAARVQVLEGLGLEDLPSEGDYFVQKVDPEHQWLAANEKPLKRVFEAARRSKFYVPVLPPSSMDEGMGLARLTYAESFGVAALLLESRARKQLSAGDFQGAWEDAITLLRLGRLASQYGTPLYAMAGAGMVEKRAIEIATEIATSGGLSAKASKEMAEGLARLPVRLNPKDLVRLDRLFSLEMFSGIPFRGASDVDLNILMRECNRWFDLLDTALAQKEIPDQVEQARSARKQFLSRYNELKDNKSGVALIIWKLFTTPESKREFRSHLLPVVYVEPSLEGALNFFLESLEETMRLELLRVALALAAYRADHEVYPEALDEIVPIHLAEPPVDIFTEKPLKYIRQEDGYLLYSAGTDLWDDGGHKEKDVILRVPTQPK